jgi:hypothetical protein
MIVARRVTHCEEASALKRALAGLAIQTDIDAFCAMIARA